MSSRRYVAIFCNSRSKICICYALNLNIDLVNEATTRVAVVNARTSVYSLRIHTQSVTPDFAGLFLMHGSPCNVRFRETSKYSQQYEQTCSTYVIA